MVIRIRDTETRSILGTLSEFISFIWTERFKTYGDFELVLPLTKKHFELIKIDRYIEIPTSSNLMVVENIYVQDDDDNSKITVKGRSFESIFERRIIYNWRNTEDNLILSAFLSKLFNENLLKDAIQDRKVDWIYLSVDIPKDIDEESFQTDINRGDNLGDSIYMLGNLFGFCPITTFDPYDRKVSIYFYFGNKTGITFKHANYNLSNSNYQLSFDDFKTSAMVAGSGEEDKRVTIVVSRSITETVTDQEGNIQSVITSEYKGVTRREMFVDARDIQKNKNESNDSYKKRLKERGIDKLKENNKSYIIDGTITNTGRYVLNRDYKLGDIVNIESNFYSASARITEIIQSWSDIGYEIYPSFETIDVFNGDISETYNIT